MIRGYTKSKQPMLQQKVQSYKERFILTNRLEQGQIISLTGLLARVSLKQLKIEFYWLMLPAVIGIYMFTKTINLLV